MMASIYGLGFVFLKKNSMRILITGATGLIGQEIVKQCLENDIQVNYLTTNKTKISSKPNYQGFYWDPTSQKIDKKCFENVEAIIHLVGATVSKRWTKTHKRAILNSRTETTRLLVASLKAEKHRVKQVISASAIGIYPDSLMDFYKEDSTVNTSDSFLGQVVHEWEHSIESFSELAISVSKIRIGLVLSNKGGALPKIVTPIRFGLGAAFGSGKQWQSWIHINDLAQMFLHVLSHKLDGVYNGVAPNPVTNQSLTKTIASILKRPLFLPNIPKFFLQLLLGEMHTLLFQSQRVSCEKIQAKDFVYKFENLDSALVDLMSKK